MGKISGRNRRVVVVRFLHDLHSVVIPSSFDLFLFKLVTSIDFRKVSLETFVFSVSLLNLLYL